MALPVSNPPVQLEKSYEKKERKKPQLFKGTVFLEFLCFLFSHNPMSGTAAYLPDRGQWIFKYKICTAAISIEKRFPSVKPLH